jgi:hypothetical protein
MYREPRGRWVGFKTPQLCVTKSTTIRRKDFSGVQGFLEFRPWRVDQGAGRGSKRPGVHRGGGGGCRIPGVKRRFCASRYQQMAAYASTSTLNRASGGRLPLGVCGEWRETLTLLRSIPLQDVSGRRTRWTFPRERPEVERSGTEGGRVLRHDL